MTHQVVVVHHVPAARAAICAAVESRAGLTVAAVAGTAARGADLVHALRPAAVVADMFLPDGDACGLVRQAAGGPDRARAGVVVVTDFATSSAAAVCRSFGILTCLHAAASPESIAAATEAAAAGRHWFGEGAVAPDAEPLLNVLQAEILASIASGDGNGAIARRLGYSVNYVKDVVVDLRTRLGARDRAHAASLGVALRLVRPGGPGRFAPALPG